MLAGRTVQSLRRGPERKLRTCLETAHWRWAPSVLGLTTPFTGCLRPGYPSLSSEHCCWTSKPRASQSLDASNEHRSEEASTGRNAAAALHHSTIPAAHFLGSGRLDIGIARSCTSNMVTIA